MKYPIVEIFSSFQGEGCLLGTPATFIRIAGCNLACPWCDTKKSWTTKDQPMMTVEEIVKKCDKQFVVITGGEPLTHNLLPLLQELNVLGKYVAIETNGSLPIDDEVNSLINWVTCSPKPGKYEMKVYPNELKFVVGGDDTVSNEAGVIEAMKRLMPKGRMLGKVAIWLQPEGTDWKGNIQKCIRISMEHPEMNCRVGMQMHKIISEVAGVEVE